MNRTFNLFWLPLLTLHFWAWRQHHVQLLQLSFLPTVWVVGAEQVQKVNDNDVAKGDLNHLKVFYVTHKIIVPINLLLMFIIVFRIENNFLFVLEIGYGLDQADDDSIDKVGNTQKPGNSADSPRISMCIPAILVFLFL